MKKKPTLGLKPCPFCGATEPTVRLSGHKFYRVLCDKYKGAGCGASLWLNYPNDRDHNITIAAWNTRADDPSPPPLPVMFVGPQGLTTVPVVHLPRYIRELQELLNDAIKGLLAGVHHETT